MEGSSVVANCQSEVVLAGATSNKGMLKVIERSRKSVCYKFKHW